MGHMNVMWYVGKFDEATWNLLAGLGLTPAYLRTNARGMVAASQEIDYLREVVAGDTVLVVSRLLEVRSKAVRIQHRMRDAVSGEAVAETTIVGVHFDTAQRKSCPLPPDIRAAAERFRSTEPG
jgi:acyl-CoA thioester hydrolase